MFNKDDLFRDALRKQISLSTCFGENAGWGWHDDEKCWNGPDYTPILDDDIADNQHFDKCYQAQILQYHLQ